MANVWHELEVGDHEDAKWGVVKMEPECGCTTEEPCRTLTAYYSHNLVPGVLENGLYRMRLGTLGFLEVERAQ